MSMKQGGVFTALQIGSLIVIVIVIIREPAKNDNHESYGREALLYADIPAADKHKLLSKRQVDLAIGIAPS